MSTLHDRKFVHALVQELEAEHTVVLASVLDTKGSMPRHEGARMCVRADGSSFGTVGGGNIEFIATKQAVKLLESEERATLEWYTHERNAMACGGDLLLGLLKLTAEELPHFQAIEHLLTHHGVAELREDWSNPAQWKASLIAHDLAADLIPHIVFEEAEGRYREPICSIPTCHIFGLGHVGTALVPVIETLGYDVALYDDREEVGDFVRTHLQKEITIGAFSEIAAQAPLYSHDLVVVLTHGHRGDAAVLEQVLKRPLAYAGCIGSRRKAQLVKDQLVASGIDPEVAANLHLPIGLSIGANTPAEIAIAIAGEIIACQSGVQQ